MLQEDAILENTNVCSVCNVKKTNVHNINICDDCLSKIDNSDSASCQDNNQKNSMIPSKSINDLALAIRESNNVVHPYYRSMNEWISTMEKLNDMEDSIIDNQDEEVSFTIRLATYCSFILNCVLLLAKGYAMSTSNSHTIMSSLTDSCLDIIGGIIISITAASSKETEEDKYKYPVGKSRVSTVGILIFSVLMSCCTVYIILKCLTALATHQPPPETTPEALFVMIFTIIIKFFMWIIFTWLGHPITLTLAADHKNDVLTNSLGLFMYWGSSKLLWWMDSAGGLILSFFVLNLWSKNAYENAKLLMGESASSDIIRELTYVAAHHHQAIKSISNVVAYQIGPKYFAEIYITFKKGTSLKSAQQISDSLKARILNIKEIENVYIHLASDDPDEKKKTFKNVFESDLDLI